MRRLIIVMIIILTILSTLLIPYLAKSTTTNYNRLTIDNEPIKELKNILNRSISINLRIYRILPDGEKKLVYEGSDPPTMNFYELLLAFLGYKDFKVITTDNKEISSLYKLGGIKICIGTGSTTNPVTATNLVQQIACTSNIVTNFTETSEYATAIIKALIFLSSATTITEVGYISTYYDTDGYGNIYGTYNILLFYDNVNISSQTALLIEYIVNVSYTPPLTQSYWHLIFNRVLQLTSVQAPISTNGNGLEIYFSRSWVDVYFCPYFSYSPTTSLSGLSTSCISGRYILGINTTITSNELDVSIWMSPPSTINLGTIAIVVNIPYTYYGGNTWVSPTATYIAAIIPISSSNSLQVTYKEWIKINIEITVG